MASLGLAFVLLVSLVSPTSSCTDQDKRSLLWFLAGLSNDGSLAASWRDGKDCCKWEGITCSTDRVVTGVSLASKNLEGNISMSLGNLTGLKLLNLSHNSLSGGLPRELLSSHSITILDVSFNQLNGALPKLPSSTPARPLQVLNISTNLFTGEFPSSIWKAAENLIALNTSKNSFTGQIPTHFCDNSPSFAVLDLSYNKFSGSIPLGLGDCSMLRVLNTGYNNLSGTLPNELFNATTLEYMCFRNNKLHGVLGGAHIIKLGNLVTLDLGRNNFSGNIPDSVGQLQRMEELYFDHNSMSGELPSTLSNCTNLITINLKWNKFSGELSKVDFSKLPNLITLDLLYNNFSGTIPESIYSCSNLIALRLSYNNLHGQLSPQIGDLKHITFLSLASNSFMNITNALQILQNCRQLTVLLIGYNFKGELMPEDDIIDGFQNLRVLAINGCQLLGNIPLWISKLANLEMLKISSNQLTGSIPVWIKAPRYLFYLDISNNSLTGEIPTTLMDMPMLKSEKTEPHLDPGVFALPVYSAVSRQYRKPIGFPKVLDLSNNKFIGEIPQEIGQLKSLLSLNLSSNYLTGQFTESVCNLTRLQVLDLSNNNLKGAIPSALNTLHSLSAFNVSNNDLEGPIPSGGQFNTFETSSFDGNTKLCGSMLIRKCALAKAPQANILSTKETSYKTAFMIAFSAFFVVGMLYDQVVLSRYFG
ncbi:receptor-like protein 3 [Lolium rigidum]|uniref:receptor-like protein 3 n=1 Tax=Lolium rigidum TaxID=89674 RepID=UPI001F5D6926|nr:receptor-like protein 3 [Lolium rigidum]